MSLAKQVGISYLDATNLAIRAATPRLLVGLTLANYLFLWKNSHIALGGDTR